MFPLFKTFRIEIKYFTPTHFCFAKLLFRHDVYYSIADSCSDQEKFYEGCTKRCSDGGNYVCPVKKLGCYCPEGQALDENNKCINTAECKCTAGNRVYLVSKS